MLEYEQFRCGITFAEIAPQVAAEYRVHNNLARQGIGTYRTFTRRAVLRRMRTIKEGMYAAYLQQVFDNVGDCQETATEGGTDTDYDTGTARNMARNRAAYPHPWSQRVVPSQAAS